MRTFRGGRRALAGARGAAARASATGIRGPVAGGQPFHQPFHRAYFACRAVIAQNNAPVLETRDLVKRYGH
jgi:hypothetical protein